MGSNVCFKGCYYPKLLVTTGFITMVRFLLQVHSSDMLAEMTLGPKLPDTSWLLAGIRFMLVVNKFYKKMPSFTLKLPINVISGTYSAFKRSAGPLPASLQSYLSRQLLLRCKQKQLEIKTLPMQHKELMRGLSYIIANFYEKNRMIHLIGCSGKIHTFRKDRTWI